MFLSDFRVFIIHFMLTANIFVLLFNLLKSLFLSLDVGKDSVYVLWL